MQVCTSLQTDNHASTPPLCFLQAGCPSCRPTNSVKALKALNASYLDIKSAFGSIDCTALWKALRSKGVPDTILHLVTGRHENTSARIRVGQKPSPPISTTSGVRQGCILLPILFCVAIDCIVQHMSFNPGITVVSSTFTDLVYADDTVLLLPSTTDATTSLKSFSESASHLGLNIAWPKTKLQNICSGPKPPNISVNGNTVESVDSFVATAVYNHRMVSVTQT